MRWKERQAELGRFLRDRRSRLTPGDVGLSPVGRRRVPGLRREEVATLAGVGVSWYTMLENGTASGVSADVLDAIARALRLRDDETAYLHRLAEQRQGSLQSSIVNEDLNGALRAIAWAPAYILTSGWTVLAWNEAMTLVWDIEPPGSAPFNIVRRTFTDPAIRRMHGKHFDGFARALVSMVRAGTAAWLENDDYQQLCEELRGNAEFAAAWDAYEVSSPLSAPETLVTSERVGPFRYRPVTLEAPGSGAHWLVVQVPDNESAVRLRAHLA